MRRSVLPLLIMIMMIMMVIMVALLTACDSNQPKTGTGTAGAPAPDRELPVLATVPAFALTDQHGSAFGSSNLAHKAWVANFIFTRCRATCPVQTANMARLQTKLTSSSPVRLVSISVDPTHDTPEVLAAYASSHKVDGNQWRFLTGARDTIWDLSKEGFKLGVGENPPGGTNPLFHSPKFVLVDGVGRIRGYYDGMTDDGIAELQTDIGRLLDDMPVAAATTGFHAAQAKDPTQIPVPDDLFAPDWLEERAQAQRETATQLDIFHGFSFTDVQPESGIRFRHRVVDDAGRTYKPAHYDHGNGVAVADVDGDGWLDLYFVNQVGSNELWRNLGDGRFANMTEAAGVAVREPIGVTASFADIDNDGDPDLYVTNVRTGNLLFENDGTGVFRDITEVAGVGYQGYSSAATFFDYDRDGLLDLFVSNVGEYTSNLGRPVVNDPTTGPDEHEYVFLSAHEDAFAGHLKEARNELSVLYRNLGGNRFQDVTETAQLIDLSWSGDATPIDANDDGWLDLYVLNMQGHDEYYENVGGAYFAKKSHVVFPRTPWGSMGVKVFDFDNDGTLDVYISDMHSDMSEEVGPEREHLKSDMQWPESLLGAKGLSIYGNAFYRKTGPDAYEEISDDVGAENYWPWGLSVGDLNADGYDDVFLASSMNFPFRYGANSLLLNDRGRRFVDMEFVLGAEPRRDGRTAAPWFELDCSGDDWGHAECEGRKGRITVWGSLGSRSSVIFDFDDDGDLDIVTNDFNTEPLVLRSDLSERTNVNALVVELVGKTSNRSGLGAIVTVEAKSGTYTKVHDGKSGYLSQSDMPLYFGLGDANRVDRVTIKWPSGHTQTVVGPIAANTPVVIEEE